MIFFYKNTKIYYIFSQLFFLFLVTNTFSQNQQAIEITNNYNANYIAVEDSHIEILLPNNYEKSNMFLGFTNYLNNGTIVISEIQNEIYKSFLSINKNQLLKKGLLVNKEIFYKINNYEALFIECKQRSQYGDYIKFILMIGDIRTTVNINASIPNSAKENEIDELKNSILSVIFNPNKKNESKTIENFSIDTIGTNLKYANKTSNSIILSEDGITPTLSPNHTTLIIREINLPIELNQEQEIKLVEKIINKNPLKPPENYIIKKLIINNKQAYQLYYQANIIEKSIEETIFITVIFNKNNCYTIMGNCIGEHEKNLTDFLKITNSIKIN